MIAGDFLPIRKIAKKTGISIQTAFDWHHKLLCGLRGSADNFDGSTEVDDVWFPYSQKGRKGLQYPRKRGGSKRKGGNNFQVKVLMTYDRQLHRNISVAKIGRISKSDIERKIGGKFNENCTLVSDKHRSIAAFAKSQKINHVSFKSSDHTAGDQYHVQNVNNLASRLKSIVNHRLRGVSTKYLQSYANWFGLTEDRKHSRQSDKMHNIEIIENTKTWKIYSNIEEKYKKFIENQSVRTYRCPTKRRWITASDKTCHSSEIDYV